MNDDFPAAHSMDTFWFALDAEGRVAIAYSGEPGAVPLGCPQGETGGEVVDLIRAGAPRNRHDYAVVDGDVVGVQQLASPRELVGVVEERVRERGGALGEGGDDVDSVLEYESISSVFVVLNDPDAAADIEADRGVVLLRDQRVLYVEECRLDLLWAEYRRGRVGGLARLPGWSEYELARLLGFYVYEASSRWAFAPVYTRVEVPNWFASAETLTAEFAQRLPVMPVSFASGARFQPVEHVDSYSWEHLWEDLNGEVHEF